MRSASRTRRLPSHPHATTTDGAADIATSQQAVGDTQDCEAVLQRFNKRHATTSSVPLRKIVKILNGELEQELVRRIVDRPRLEAFKKRLAKQQARVRRRNARFYVFDNKLTNLQRPDLEDGLLRG
jgi:hypothetical protein